MKKVVFGMAILVSVFSCGRSDREMAQKLLDEARESAARSEYERARELIDSLRRTYPAEIEVRRDALAAEDSIELAAARKELAIIDSVLTFSRFELEDMKSQFVLEKDEKYQTVGNYVAKAYAGDKTKLSFFIQVNEEGTMQLVTIDKARKYTVQEAAVNGRGGDAVLPESATSADFEALNQSYALAKAIQDNRAAVEQWKKAEVKVKFYERKKNGKAPAKTQVEE